MKSLTLHDRVVAYGRTEYARKWPDSQPYVSPTGRWLYGTWSCGNLFVNPSRYPGAYPRTILERTLSLFPEVRENRILHLFSGSVPAGRWTRLDIHPAPIREGYVVPEIVGSAYELPALLEGWDDFHLYVCDAPYQSADSQVLYGTPNINTARAFRAMAAAAKPGTHVAWLDTAPPLYRKDQWDKWGSITVDDKPETGEAWEHWGDVSIERSTGNDYRKLSLYTRRAA